MSESGSNPFWSFLVGVGRFINFINHFVFNIIMIVLLILVIGLIGIGIAAKNGSSALSPVQNETALVLDLEGTLVEQYTSSPIQRAIDQATSPGENGEMQLRDLMRALELAKDDPKIDRLIAMGERNPKIRIRMVDKSKFNEEARIIRLFTPPFEDSDKDPGYIKSYPPGIRENGGQYTHAALWAIWAFAELGQGDRAHERGDDDEIPDDHERHGQSE